MMLRKDGTRQFYDEYDVVVKKGDEIIRVIDTYPTRKDANFTIKMMAMKPGYSLEIVSRPYKDNA